MVLTQPRRGLPSPLQPRSRSHLSSVLCRLPGQGRVGTNQPHHVFWEPCPQRTLVSVRAFPTCRGSGSPPPPHSWQGQRGARVCPGDAGRAGGGWGLWLRAEKLSVCFPHSCCQVSRPLPHQGSRSPQRWAISISQAGTPPPVPGQRGCSFSCPLNKRGSTRPQGGPWQRLGGAAAAVRRAGGWFFRARGGGPMAELGFRGRATKDTEAPFWCLELPTGRQPGRRVCP